MKFVLLISLIATLALGAGCGKKSEEASEGGEAAPAASAPAAEAPTGSEIIPGQNAIQEAMAQKDYNGAVQRYVALKAAVATPEQNAEYIRLFGELRDDLMNASQTDKNAAEALAAIRAIRAGR